MKNQPFDLFGEIPITEEDLRNWVAAVSPRWLEPERSYHQYLRTYSIAEKVRRAKLEGTFEATISRPPRVFHARLALAAIL